MIRAIATRFGISLSIGGSQLHGFNTWCAVHWIFSNGHAKFFGNKFFIKINRLWNSR